MQGFVRRIAVPALLLACVGIEWSRGGDSLPTWVANLSIKTGMGADRALRILIALELCGAVLALLSSRLSRPIAWIAGVGLAFSALAELSAIINAPGKSAVAAGVWMAPLAWLALGAGILNKDKGTYVPFTVKKGDSIIFSSYAGTEVKIDGEPYLIMTEEEILGIVE